MQTESHNFSLAKLETALENTRKTLLGLREPDGYWCGELASSALATATAVVALGQMNNDEHRELIVNGLKWLADNANADGGWGDTVLSVSNISTTVLCWAAFAIEKEMAKPYETTIAKARQWINDAAGSVEIEAIVETVNNRYGKDRTFSAPILSHCAISGRFDEDIRPWQYVFQLPFELAIFPHRLYKALNLRVISYALPALISIGLNRHVQQPTRNPITRIIRNLIRKKTMAKLATIQPTNGGFLEAVPLTSFVAMNLSAAGFTNHSVTEKCIQFIVNSVRSDGSWAIDTDLATWVSTLSVNALSDGENLEKHLSPTDRQRLIDWLLRQQFTQMNPYIHAEPGGWSWTDKPGNIPDADDTAGALLALWHLIDAGEGGAIKCQNEEIISELPIYIPHQPVIQAAHRGISWLLNLQNSDGGIPTFCKGWGKLPFDRSSNDITAHGLLAFNRWHDKLPAKLQTRVQCGIKKGLTFLGNSQNPDGSWDPLWFGNQNSTDDKNPTYGTARVMPALVAFGKEFPDTIEPMLVKSIQWLLSAQNTDNGWGGGTNSPSSIEETAIAVYALAKTAPMADSLPVFDTHQGEKITTAISQGTNWLIQNTQTGTHFPPTPIGFYFAKLWYYEKLYPTIFTVAALEATTKMGQED